MFSQNQMFQQDDKQDPPTINLNSNTKPQSQDEFNFFNQNMGDSKNKNDFLMPPGLVATKGQSESSAHESDNATKDTTNKFFKS